MNQYVEDLQNSILGNLNKAVDNRNLYYNNLTKTIVVLIFFVLLFMLCKKGLNRMNLDPNKQRRIHRRIKNTLLTLCLILISIIWINALNSLVIILILLALFATVLIRSTLDNIIGWYFIRKRHYFKLNQRIEIGDKIGKVVGVNFFYFEIAEIKNWLTSESFTGRIIKIPNKEILDNEVFNYNYLNQMVRQEISFIIRHDSNYYDAKEIVEETLHTYYENEIYSMNDGELYEKLNIPSEPSFHLDIAESGLVLSCQFLVDFHKVSAVKTKLNETILEAFNTHPEIEFAVLEIKQVN
ncbi:mechanosensitive ion channel domain-containing protein [Vagococcus fluvialis]|uniref:mechanosensitive ion channel domain-containing protein n=1 Tax=Vagococcus fluvialis TaxID=2738 RepID=UPI001A8E245D|nr:mechanosensitive ion channel domain-containing protein [Vagococcus fluvialis]MBO0436982.1 mechanosensitive ion channel family protein [Vagococcus fluvialis]